MAFQAYLREGLARWKLQRSEDSMERVGGKVTRSFDISLKHRMNALSSAIHNEPALSNFCTPPSYTGEIIGVSYLRSQTGDVQLGEMQELSQVPMGLNKRTVIPISTYWVYSHCHCHIILFLI